MNSRNIVIFISSLFILLSCNDGNKKETTPKAIKGTLDLQNWNFAEDGPVKLDGEWEFYWNRLFESKANEEHQSPSHIAYSRIPGLWNSEGMENQPVSNSGYATYRLKVMLHEPITDLAIKVMAISTAAKVFINGNPIVSIGEVGISENQSKPKVSPQVVPFKLNTDSLEIVIQISNYTGLKGGVWDPIFIGIYKELQAQKTKNIGLDFFLFGSVFMIGLYHIALFMYWRRDHAPLYFGLACMFIAAYSLMTGEIALLSVFPQMSFEHFAKIHMVNGLIAGILLLGYFALIFPREFSKTILRTFQAIYLLFLVFTIFTSFKVYSNLAKYESLLFILAGGYSLYCIFSAWNKGNREAKHFALGFTVFIITVLNDAYKLIGWELTTGYTLTSYGLFFFVLVQSNLLSKRLFNAFHSVENLSHQLENKNVELVRLDRLKDDFLSNISHELKNPIHGMIGLAETMILTGKHLPRETHSSLSLIATTGKRLTRLVSDILDFAKLRNSDLKLNLKPTDIRQLIEVVIRLHKPLSDLKSLRITNSIPLNTSRVLVDEDRVLQVMHNLLGNAIKFTENGDIEISAVNTGNQLKVSVKDSGIGIPREQQISIFESFRQAETSETRHYEGTGLGLSIAKELINLHGGDIDVASVPGEGSVFSFTLPIAEMNSGESISLAPGETRLSFSPQVPAITEPDIELKTDNSSDNRNEGTILVVDDDPVNLKIVTAYLTPHNFKVIHASNGHNALAILENNRKPDIVLLDIMMPGMSGFELCEAIRKQAGHSLLPIIFLTAKQQVEDLENAFKLGGNDYITKPFSAGELLSRISNQLKSANASRKLESLRRVAELLSHQKDSAKIMSIVFKEISQQIELDGACLVKEKMIEESLHLDPSIILKFLKQKGRYETLTDLVKEDIAVFTNLQESDDLYKLLKDLTNQPLQNSDWVLLQFEGFDEYAFCLYKKNSSLGFSQGEIEYFKNLIKEVKAVLGNLRNQSLELKSNSKYIEVAKDLNRTVYIKGGGGGPYVTAAFDSEEFQTQTHRISLQNLQTYFSEELLLRVHHSYLINPLLVNKDSKPCVYKEKRNYKIKMLDYSQQSFEIPVSNKYYDKLKSSHPEWFEQ